MGILSSRAISGWLSRTHRTADVSAAEPGLARDPRRDARDAFRLSTIASFHTLIRHALGALQAHPEEQAQELKILDDLGLKVTAADSGDERLFSKLESRVQADCEHLTSYIGRQRELMVAREEELSDVVGILTRSVAEGSEENKSFYSEVRAEGNRIEEASRTDDVQKLRSVLEFATARLHGLVERKETKDQSRIDALTGQVEALTDELQAARACAETDALTGAMNRRAFDIAINSRVRRLSGGRHSFALICFDIDDFKLINDRFGHPIGDRALIAFTQHCRSMLRQNDLLARHGGEEFAMILDRTSVRHGLKRAQSICAGVANQPYAIDTGPKNRTLSMTVSAGVTAMRQGDTAKDIVRRADEALYAAKAAGKNQAVAIK